MTQEYLIKNITTLLQKYYKNITNTLDFFQKT